MKLLLIALLALTQTGITLTGTSNGTTGTLHWTNSTSYTIRSYTIRKKVNAGNLKNAYTTVATFDGSVNDATVDLTSGKNTFVVVGVSVPIEGTSYGITSNEINLK